MVAVADDEPGLISSLDRTEVVPEPVRLSPVISRYDGQLPFPNRETTSSRRDATAAEEVEPFDSLATRPEHDHTSTWIARQRSEGVIRRHVGKYRPRPSNAAGVVDAPPNRVPGRSRDERLRAVRRSIGREELQAQTTSPLSASRRIS